jgi:hypothetical protein
LRGLLLIGRKLTACHHLRVFASQAQRDYDTGAAGVHFDFSLPFKARPPKTRVRRKENSRVSQRLPPDPRQLHTSQAWFKMQLDLCEPCILGEKP